MKEIPRPEWTIIDVPLLIKPPPPCLFYVEWQLDFNNCQVNSGILQVYFHNDAKNKVLYIDLLEHNLYKMSIWKWIENMTKCFTIDKQAV